MRALVTGSAGFVGSHLCDRLLRDGWDVTGVDNYATSDGTNLRHLGAEPRFEFIEADVTATSWLAKTRHATPHTAVFHLASPASPYDYARLPLETMHANSLGTEHALEIAARDGARFVLASTSEIYGDPLVHPQVESDWGNVNPNGPRSCYDEGKRYAEALTGVFARTRDVDARIARIFNTYGPRMRDADGRVIPAFIASAIRGRPLPIFGAGLQTRAFTYVDDLVDGLVRLAVRDLPPQTRTFNLGCPRETTIRELAQIVGRLCAVPIETKSEGLPIDDPKRRLPDIGRARRELGWEPTTDLESGLRATIADFRRRLLAPVAG